MRRHEWVSGMLTAEQIRSDKHALLRTFRCLANIVAFVLVASGFAFSAPAVACVCSCSVFSSPGKDSAAAEVTPADYHEVFSGLVLSTERIDQPVAAAPVSGEKVIEDPGRWIRSRILVLRIWRGAPSTVAEVWTPVVTDCDSPPMIGSYFVALVRSQDGRSVASNSICDCARKAAATAGRGDFAVAGIAISAAAIFAAAIALVSLVKVIRGRRPS